MKDFVPGLHARVRTHVAAAIDTNGDFAVLKYPNTFLCRSFPRRSVKRAIAGAAAGIDSVGVCRAGRYGVPLNRERRDVPDDSKGRDPRRRTRLPSAAPDEGDTEGDAPGRRQAGHRAHGKTAYADAVEEVTELARQGHITYLDQYGPYGNGTPVLNAARAFGDEPVLVLWPDDVFVAEVPRAQQLIRAYEQTGCPVL